MPWRDFRIRGSQTRTMSKMFSIPSPTYAYASTISNDTNISQSRQTRSLLLISPSGFIIPYQASWHPTRKLVNYPRFSSLPFSSQVPHLINCHIIPDKHLFPFTDIWSGLRKFQLNLNAIPAHSLRRGGDSKDCALPLTLIMMGRKRTINGRQGLLPLLLRSVNGQDLYWEWMDLVRVWEYFRMPVGRWSGQEISRIGSTLLL